MSTPFTAELPPFDPDEDPSTTPQHWKNYLRKVERALVAWGIKEDARKHSILLHCGGDKLDLIEQNLVYDKTANALFENLKTALNTYFEPKRNVTFSTYVFCQMKQEEGEGIDAFVTRLRNQASMCDFADENRRIKDQVVFRCLSKKVRNKALADDQSLEDLLKNARCQETAQREAGEIEKGLGNEGLEFDALRISKQPGKYSAKLKQGSQFSPQAANPQPTTSTWNRDKSNRPRQNNYQFQGQKKPEEGCRYCVGPRHPREDCPAKDKTCFNCNLTGHFSARCRSKRPIRQLETDTNQDDEEESDCESQFAYRVTAVNNVDMNSDTDNFPMLVNDQKLKFCLDLGSHGDIIPMKEYDKMRPKPELEWSDQKFRAFGAEKTFKSRGCFVGSLKASVEGKAITSKIHVVDLPGKTCCLLSKKSCTKLGLITFNLPKNVNAVSSPSISGLIDQFPEVFESGI